MCAKRTKRVVEIDSTAGRCKKKKNEKKEKPKKNV